MLNLIALKVPQHWAVLYNSFSDEPMEVSDGFIDNFHHYKEDLLWIAQVTLSKKGGYQIEEGGLSLDVGWYPDSDPNGAFRLVVFKDKWDDVLFTVTSKNCYTIQQTIDECLEACYMNGEQAMGVAVQKLADERDDLVVKFGE